MKPRPRLGRGIDAIFPESLTTDGGSQIIELDIDAVIANPIQPRKEFDKDGIDELASSIRENGVISPIVVRQIEGKYEIIAGERRYRASKQVGLERIPAIVREMSDREAFKVSLIENLQREDLNPIEEAEAYHTLSQQFELTHQAIAESIGKDRTTVTNMLRLMSLAEEIKDALRQNEISMGHAKAILAIENLNERLAVLNKIKQQGLSVRDTEKLTMAAKKPAKLKKDVNSELSEMADRISEKLGARVQMNFSGKRGKIVIEVASKNELERIVGELTGYDSPL